MKKSYFLMALMLLFASLTGCIQESNPDAGLVFVKTNSSQTFSVDASGDIVWILNGNIVGEGPEFTFEGAQFPSRHVLVAVEKNGFNRFGGFRQNFQRQASLLRRSDRMILKNALDCTPLDIKTVTDYRIWKIFVAYNPCDPTDDCSDSGDTDTSTYTDVTPTFTDTDTGTDVEDTDTGTDVEDTDTGTDVEDTDTGTDVEDTDTGTDTEDTDTGTDTEDTDTSADTAPDYSHLIGNYNLTGFVMAAANGTVIDQDNAWIPAGWSGALAVTADGRVEASINIPNMELEQSELSYDIIEVDGGAIHVSFPECETGSDWIDYTQNGSVVTLTLNAGFCQATPPEGNGYIKLEYTER